MTTAIESPDFVLKHRVVGAAILLLVGALIVPWLLGPPDALENDVQDNSSAAVLLDPLVDTVDVIAETVTTQTTPPDTEPVADKQETVADKQKPVADKQESVADKQETVADKQESVADKQETVADKQKPVADKQETVLISKITPADGDADNWGDSQTATPKAVDKDKPASSTSSASASTPEATTTPTKIANNGRWVVQVGVFTDKQSAKQLVEKLRAQGFKPSTTVVDTNRGRATGTRVWLGPFAQRDVAADTLKRFIESTGEHGFIRKYP